MLGVTAGVIGSLQAFEVIKFIAGAGKTVSNALLAFDGTHASFRTIAISRDPQCTHCSHL